MGWNDHCYDPQDTCFECHRVMSVDDALEFDNVGNVICWDCFEKKLMKAEGDGEGDR